MPECDSTISGMHQWSMRKRQIGSYHPTVKESWQTYIGCVCGREAPMSMVDDIKKQWSETKKAAQWKGETGEQPELGL